MGYFFGLFQCNDVEELKAAKARLIEKKTAIDEEIKAIEERIAKVESKD